LSAPRGQMGDVECFFLNSGAGLWEHSKTCTEFVIPDPANDDGVRAEPADPTVVVDKPPPPEPRAFALFLALGAMAGWGGFAGSDDDDDYYDGDEYY
jgi:hypothetical protein